MISSKHAYDAVVIGGGFYGATISIYLARQMSFKKVLLVEQENALLKRASYNNQARVHNGYHYPRSFTTAYRSRINLPRFLHDWPQAVKKDFTKLYAIARKNSKVTAKQFERFCQQIGAEIERVDESLQSLFNPRLIEDVFLVREYAFDTTVLASWAHKELGESGTETLLNTRVTSISKTADGSSLHLSRSDGTEDEVTARYVFNCTYSGLNQFSGSFPGTRAPLKQEITEMALVKLPPSLQNFGITVMDGPFFSIVPFPAKKLHTLSHVRYTPHSSWNDTRDLNPYRKLEKYDKATRVDRMVRDAARYIPDLAATEYVESLFEVKTVLQKNETDDGRPILFEKYEALPGCYSILGGKIDNIYDVLEKLENELRQA